jgi:hypothetical protein
LEKTSQLPSSLSYTIYPLGDTTITIDYGNFIDEKINRHVLNVFEKLKQLSIPGIIEIIPAYSSLAIHYDVFSVRKKANGSMPVHVWMKLRIEEILLQFIDIPTKPGRLVRIPVCYDQAFAMDMDRLSNEKNLSREEIIHLHCGGSRNPCRLRQAAWALPGDKPASILFIHRVAGSSLDERQPKYLMQKIVIHHC